MERPALESAPGSASARAAETLATDSSEEAVVEVAV
jgi:hypothetical protein